MIRKLLLKLARVAWFLPGFLLWAAFPPMGEKADVMFALAPLMWLSRRADARTSAKRWFQSGIFFWVATLAWMPAIVKNGGPWPLVVLGWGALAAYCAAYFAAYGWLSAKAWAWARGGAYARRLIALVAIEPILWCGLELVRSRFGGGFAWNQLGVVPVNGGYGAPAALGGVYLCSAVVILVNGAIASVAERMWRPDPKLPKLARPLETLLPFLLVWGLYRVSPAPSVDVPAEGALKVAMVQRNFPCVFKPQEAEHPWLVYSNLFSTVSYVQPELLVLSESALCEFGLADSANAREFARRALALTGARGMLAGASRREAGHEYNSAALYSAEGDWQVYDKVHLVPFGEYIPGDKWIEALQRLAPVGSCTPGELKTLDFDGSRVGVAICFEDTDSAQMRRLAEQGAELLLFITNDSWFSHSVEAEQHAWQAVARAIETGLHVVRTGNSGVSGSIAPDGTASWLADASGRALVDCRGTMLTLVPRPAATAAERDVAVPRTVYVLLGDKPLAMLFGLLILGMILVQYKETYEKRRTLSL